MAKLTGKGSEQAFARLYERYNQTLYRYCRSIVRDDADAQDALQSTFTAALDALQRGQRKAPVRPWLFRIAHNEAITVLRRRRFAGTDLPDATGQFASSAEDQAATRARFAQLIADLNELPDRARAALLMRELSGLSHEEIAIALETSVGAAKQAIFDARRALHDLAEGRALACEEIRKQISDGDGRALRSRRTRAHLRDCATCSAFAAAIPARRAELRALVPPLPVAASAALLSRAMSATSAHGTNTAASGSLATGAMAKAAGSAIASKVVGVVVVLGAAASVGGVTASLVHGRSAPVKHAGHVLIHRSNTHAGPAPDAHHASQSGASASPHRANGHVRPGSNRHPRASAGMAQPVRHNPHRSGAKAGRSGVSGVGRRGSRGSGPQNSSGHSHSVGRNHAAGKSARLGAPGSSHRKTAGLGAGSQPARGGFTSHRRPGGSTGSQRHPRRLRRSH